MIANGTLKTIEDNEDIYVSLTQLCDYFVKASVNMRQEIKDANMNSNEYAKGLSDMMFTLADELVTFGKFEAQRRMIETPDDLLRMVSKDPFGQNDQ